MGEKSSSSSVFVQQEDGCEGEGGGPVSELTDENTVIQMWRIFNWGKGRDWDRGGSTGAAEPGSDRMTILKDALNCREPKAGLEMSLSNWDKVCSGAPDGPWLSLWSAWTLQGKESRGGVRVRCFLPPLPGFACTRIIVHLHLQGARGWEKAAALGSSGDQPWILPSCSCQAGC